MKKKKLKLHHACAAEIFTKTSVKSTVFELQNSYRHNSSCTINFQKNETNGRKVPKRGKDAPPLCPAMIPYA